MFTDFILNIEILDIDCLSFLKMFMGRGVYLLWNQYIQEMTANKEKGDPSSCYKNHGMIDFNSSCGVPTASIYFINLAWSGQK